MSSFSAAQSPSSRTHAASLLPVDAHSPALLALVAVQVDTDVLRQSFFPSYLLALVSLFHSQLTHTYRTNGLLRRPTRPALQLWLAYPAFHTTLSSCFPFDQPRRLHR
jgi:hypothetical protein